MTNQQILEKAIQKAIGGGWKALQLNGAEHWLEATPEHRTEDVRMMIVIGSKTHSESFRNTIYDHDFAKALWGEEMQNHEFRKKAFGEYRPAWQGHLMQMVIAEDPIKYLGENL